MLSASPRKSHQKEEWELLASHLKWTAQTGNNRRQPVPAPQTHSHTQHHCVHKLSDGHREISPQKNIIVFKTSCLYSTFHMIHYFHFADMIYCPSIVSSCNHNRNLPLLTWIFFLYIRPRKSGRTSFIGSATQANRWKQTFSKRSFFQKFAEAFAVRK